MAKMITLPTHTDPRGSLTVVEDQIGFPIRRVFYIYDVTAPRGGHGHKVSKTALIALGGTVVVKGQSPEKDFSHSLTNPSQCLLLEAEDWHTMEFENGSILLVLASEPFSKKDYFYEKYRP